MGMDRFTAFVDLVDDKVWGVSFTVGGYPVPLLILLILFGGIWLTLRLGGLQLRKLPLALKYMVLNEEIAHGAKGEVSSFQALCTALSATIGTGNIVGVATAYVSGGPGAIFWMWLAALFGMATKYAEGVLAVRYRDHDPHTGHVLGGPFYYIERGMGRRWKPLACAFAFFGVCVGLFGIGTFTQVNSICGALNQFFDPHEAHVVTLLGRNYSWTTVVGSALLACCVGLVVIGGLKRIARVSAKVIPLMVVLYVTLSLLLIFCNLGAVPTAVGKILRGAFGLQAAAGGALGAIIVAMQKGIARGIFSNEAGLVCSMTGLVLTLTNQPYLTDGAAQGAAATMNAFAQGLSFLPAALTNGLLTVSLVLFGFTTILGWNYYSERCLEYLTGGRQGVVLAFRWLYIAAVFIGPYMTVSAVWGIADIFNGLMAIPNMIALLALSGVVAAETKRYFDTIEKEKDRIS